MLETVVVVADGTTVATVEVEAEVEVVVRHQLSPLKGQNIQTCPLESGMDVKCTENSDEVHTSVLNQLHVHGKIFLLLVHHNEILTSLAAQYHQFMTRFTIQSRNRKYMLFVKMKSMKSQKIPHFKLSGVILKSLRSVQFRFVDLPWFKGSTVVT